MDKFLLSPLKRAAEYLKITVNGDVKMLKNDIITEIILRIESLLMDLCSICGEYYNITLKDEPAFKCVTCQQGCHQPCLEQMVTILKDVSEEIKNSFHFFCAKCLSSYSHVKPPAAKINSPAKQATHIVILPKPADEDDIDVIDDDESKDTDDDVTEPQVSQQVCRKYRRRECPHGASGKTLVDGKPCNFLHPRRCRRYAHNGTHPKYGCTKSNCELLHPVLCRYSVRNRVCLNLDCPFTHLKFTRRYDPDSSYHNQQSSYQPEQRYERTQHQQSYASEYRPQPYNRAPEFNNKPPVMTPTVNSTSTDMHFLVEMIKQVKDEFQNQFKELNQKIAAPPRQAAPMPPTLNYPTYQPMRFPLHPHC